MDVRAGVMYCIEGQRAENPAGRLARCRYEVWAPGLCPTDFEDTSGFGEP